MTEAGRAREQKKEGDAETAGDGMPGGKTETREVKKETWREDTKD